MIHIKFILSLSLLLSHIVLADNWQPSEWPILKSYDKDHLEQIALPLGGIGTGTVSLGGRGELRDWEIMNIPGKKYNTITTGNDAPFFSIYIKSGSDNPKTLALLRPLYENEYLHYEGRPVNHHGLPRFKNAGFDAAYPFGQVNLSSPDIPIKVKIKGFNPFVPTNEDESGLPIAILTYEVTNTSNDVQEISVCGSIRNFIGKDGSKTQDNWKGDYIPTGAKSNKNIYRENNYIKGIYMYSSDVDKDDPAYGTLALTTNATHGVSYRTSSVKDDWSNALLNFWDDFSQDGVLTEKDIQEDEDPMASLAIKQNIAPHETKSFTFFITWNFPNRRAWSKEIVGNYYSTVYPDAWENAEKIIPRIPELETKTLSFVRALLASSYPDVIKEAALFNLATLRSQTVFRIPSGHLMGWEGVMDRFGSCPGSCTHVWNYEVATPFLFGNLSRTMRDVEFNYATKENGLMNFRADLPLSVANKRNSPAADGQMGCIMKIYRDWQLYGKSDYLEQNWDQIKKVLSYAWIDKGWDGNQDGVMEGKQHNTMDVDYYGPNPQMGFWYMGALRAAEEMAKYMKDKEFQKKCNKLFLQGSKWQDDYLFNGEYYEHKITDPNTLQFIDMNNEDANIPKFQLGNGCLIDQLVGQYMAHICGLGYLAKEQNIKTTLHSIMKYNYLDNFTYHFNNMRSYSLGCESGLLMASWPKGRLKVPFPYFSEVMTGFEYSTAVNMIYEGQIDDAIKCITAIRERHNGSKRNPFSEPECGHHYARSMASWAGIIAWSKFQYSGVTQSMSITSDPGIYFWSNGYAWGTVEVIGKTITLSVLGGEVTLKELSFTGEKPHKMKSFTLRENQRKTIKIG